jgi:predicted anti-sigma-YlaC factor YlaD
MTCAEYQETLSAFMDGESEPGAASAALEHIGMCTDCRTFFAAAMSHRGALRQAPLPEFPHALDRRISHATKPRGVRWRERLPIPVLPGWRLAVPLPALAVVVLYLLTATILALSSLFGPGGSQAQEPTFLYVRELPQVEVVATSSDGSDSQTERSVIQ